MPIPNVRLTREARRSQRYPTNFPGELTVRVGLVPVTITNISRCGALLKGETLPLSGQIVTLRARSLDVLATVAWSKDGQVGLSFHRDVEPLEVVRQNAAEMRLFRAMRVFGSSRSA